MDIIWQDHDDQVSAKISTCGRFEAVPDPVYGYFKLRRSEDPAVSLAESMSLIELARIAAQLSTAPDGSDAPLLASPEVRDARQRYAAHAGDTSRIPVGGYCHGPLVQRMDPVRGPVLSGQACPYWALVADGPAQMNGYCAHLDLGDWQEGPSLLWDQCKECGINDPEPGMLDLEADRAAFAMLEALHRGFREQCRWTGGTDFTQTPGKPRPSGRGGIGLFLLPAAGCGHRL